MTENVKKLLEVLSSDAELSEKASQAKTIEEVIEMAKAKGIELTDEDVREATRERGTVDQSELEAVAGGKTCYCVAGGGGTGTCTGEMTCACVVIGAGKTAYERDSKGREYVRCQCFAYGDGAQMDSAGAYQQYLKDEAYKKRLEEIDNNSLIWNR